VWAGELWRTAGVPVGEVTPLPDGWRCVEQARSAVDFHVLHVSEGLRVVYCTVETKTLPPVGKIKAEAVLIHRHWIEPQPDGTAKIRQEVEAYATAGGPTVQALARIAKETFHKTVNARLEESLLYFSLMAKILPRKPTWTEAAIARLSPRLGKAEGDELRETLRPTRARKPAAAAATVKTGDAKTASPKAN
ncbi:MAG TPA: hypothetical protein VNC50_20625, partial [Planctomycetia bacterium]|nr:hypothetical protein [Planctomycetia bacterium]